MAFLFVPDYTVAEFGVTQPHEMKILSRNCQGINNSLIVKALQGWCWRERHNIVFIMESMVDKGRLERVRNRCGFTDGLCIDSSENSGGIGLWWKDMIVLVISFSPRHILVEVRSDDRDVSRSWFACGIYGWPDRSGKFKTWGFDEED